MHHLSLPACQLFQANLTVYHSMLHLETISCTQQKARNNQQHLQLDEVKSESMPHMDLMP